MSIALRAAGAWTATGATSRTPAIPSSQVTGDLMILIAAGKPYNLQWECNTAGWQSLGRGESGTTAAGTDTGSMVVEIWWKIATSDTEADPTVTEVGNSFDCVQAAVCVFSKGASESWVTPVALFGADETTGTAISVTFASNPGGKAGDYVMLGCGINTDSMGPLTTDLTPSWTGITFGTADPGIEGEGTTGGDMSAHYMSRPVSSGTASAAPTCTGTGTATGGADRLEAVFIRMRVQTIVEGEGQSQGTSTCQADSAKIAGVAASTAGTSYAGGAETLDDSYETYNAPYLYLGGSSTGYSPEAAQSFQSKGGRLSRARFCLQRADEYLYGVQAKLYAMTGTFGVDSKPTGSALAVSEILDAFAEMPLLQWYWLDFHFTGANQYDTTAGTHYCIAIRADGGFSSTEYVLAGVDNVTLSHAGNSSTLSNDETAWTANASREVCFFVYVLGANAATVIPSEASAQGTSTAQADGQDANAQEYVEADANTQGTSATNVEAAAISEIIIGAATIPKTPTDVAGLVTWWKADALALNDNDSVSTWPDSSGNGHATAPDGAQPIFKTNIVNGKPVVRFSSSRSVAWSVAAINNYTIFAVAKHTKPSGISIVNGQMDGAFDISYTSEGHLLTNAWQDAVDHSGAFHVIAVNNNPSNLPSWVDRLATGIGGSGGGNLGSVFLGLVGAGDIAEVVIYSGALSTEDRQAVENYLGAKYALFDVADGVGTAQAQSATIWATSYSGEPADFPSQISGLVGHWRADALALNDNDSVADWLNLGTKGGTLQGGTLKPVFKTNIINGKPVVRFDTYEQILSYSDGDSNLLSNDTPLTAFCVFKQTQGYPVGYNQIGPIYAHGFGMSHPFCLGATGQDTPSGVAAITNMVGGNITSDVFIQGAFHLVSGIENGASSALFVDGAQVGTGSISATGVGQLDLGSQAAYAVTWYGDIAEFCIYNVALTTTDRQAVERYLLVKYGLVAPPVIGLGIATGVSSASWVTDASTQGTSTASADSGVLAATEASTQGTSTAQADGENAATAGIIECEFTVSGTSTSQSDSARFTAQSVTLDNTSTAQAEASNIFLVEASTTATSATTITVAAIWDTLASVTNTSTVTSNSGATASIDASTTATSTASADMSDAGATGSDGTAEGTSTAQAQGATICRIDASTAAGASDSIAASAIWDSQASATCAASDNIATAARFATTASATCAASDAVAVVARWDVTGNAVGTCTTSIDMSDAGATGSDADAQGTSTVTAQSGATISTDASTSGSSTVAADSGARKSVGASAAGTCVVTAERAVLRVTSSAVVCISTAAANSGAIKLFTASAAGTSTTNAQVSDAASGADANAAGTSTAIAYSRSIIAVTASVTCTSSITAQGRSVIVAVSTVNCAAIVNANVFITFAVRVTATGVGVAIGVAEIRHFANVDVTLASVQCTTAVGVLVTANSDIQLDAAFAPMHVMPQVSVLSSVGGTLTVTRAHGTLRVIKATLEEVV